MVRRADNVLITKAASNGAWHPSQTDWWTLPGVTLAGSPTIVSPGPNRLDVFAHAADDSLEHIAWTSSGGWSAWENLGGPIKGNIAAISRASGQLDIFARNSSNQLVTKACNGTCYGSGWAPSQSGFWNLGGSCWDEPAVVSLNANRLDVFMRGGADESNGYWSGIEQFTWTNTAGWKSSLLGGSFFSPVTAVKAPDSSRIDIFAVSNFWNVGWKFTDGTNWFPSAYAISRTVARCTTSPETNARRSASTRSSRGSSPARS